MKPCYVVSCGKSTNYDQVILELHACNLEERIIFMDRNNSYDTLLEAKSKWTETLTDYYWSKHECDYIGGGMFPNRLKAVWVYRDKDDRREVLAWHHQIVPSGRVT